MWTQLEGDSVDSKLKALTEEVKKLPLIVTVGTIFNVTVIGGLNLWWSVLLTRGMIARLLGKAPVGKKDR
jgi:hypothetical protein